MSHNELLKFPLVCNYWTEEFLSFFSFAGVTFLQVIVTVYFTDNKEKQKTTDNEKEMVLFLHSSVKFLYYSRFKKKTQTFYILYRIQIQLLHMIKSFILKFSVLCGTILKCYVFWSPVDHTTSKEQSFLSPFGKYKDSYALRYYAYDLYAHFVVHLATPLSHFCKSIVII